MLIFGKKSDGDRRRRAIPVLNDLWYRSDWLEHGEDPLLSPTVALIEQPANAVLEPHFHRQNQFQVFIDGTGTIGSKTLRAFSVHYAGAYTGYGPVIAGPQGLKYFTARPVFELGFVPVTEAREKMIRGPKRSADVGPIDLLSDAERLALPAAQEETLFPIGPDGLGVSVIRMPPGSRLESEMSPASQGMFLFVLAGTLRHADTELSRLENCFLTNDAKLPDFYAGPRGAEVLLLSVPAKAGEYL